jgi:hypothetical protein
VTSGPRGPRLRVLLGAVAAAVAVSAPSPAARAASSGEPTSAAVLIVIDDVSFEQLLAVPEVRRLASIGGAALMVPQEPVPDVVARIERLAEEADGPVPTIVRLSVPPGGSGSAVAAALRAGVSEALAAAPPDALVVLAGESASPAMIARKDAVLPVVMAPPHAVAPGRGPGALTSEGTRRDGVVSSLDLVPTVLGSVGGDAPSPGAQMTPSEADAPFSLHARYLSMRRMTVPMQAAAWIYTMVAAAVLLALVLFRDRTPPSVARRASWIGLSVAPLAVGLFAAGHLPTLSYATAVPFVVAVTAAGTLAVVPLGRRGVLVPPAAIGAGVLAYLALEAATGFSGALTPLLGGSQLDGGRFYGMPNVLEGLAIGAALYLVATWAVGPALGVLVAVALFMGLPQIGADIGGALAGFTAAGLWLGIRRRGRLDLGALSLGALVGVAGTALILVLHRWEPTHATAFARGRSGGLVATALDRLEVGIDLIVRNPFAILPALGVVVLALVALRPPAILRPAADRFPRWRDAILTLALAGVVALVGNDSGPAAAGLAFGLALGGLLYVALRVAAVRVGEDGGR